VGAPLQLLSLPVVRPSVTGRPLALLLAIAGLAGGAVPATAAAPAPSVPASLRGFVCRQAMTPLNRIVEVTATMRPLAGTERMSLRFQLFERLPGQWFHLVRGGDLGRWRHPNPPTFGQQPGDTWVVNKPVANLDSPAVYRFRVTFRWVGWSGSVTKAVRLSQLCAEHG
jgi:hypothetical protein